MRLAKVVRQRLAQLDGIPRATAALLQRSAGLWHFFRLPLIAKLRRDVFAVMAVRDVMPCKVGPEVSGGRFVHVRNVFLNGIALVDYAFVVIGSFFTAICDLPGLFGVVARNRGVRPDVAITGNLSTVIEVVEHAELAREFVLVWTNVFSKHGQGR